MTGMTRPLSDADKAELENLNAALAAAIGARRDWLDVKMREYSELQVGDDIYDVRSGRKLGVVSQLYRYWRDRDDGVRDDSHYCDYKYETSPRCFDNTSRQVGVSFGTKEHARRRAEMRVKHLT